MTTEGHPITMFEPSQPQCTMPPKGWRCTRGAGHTGPCAAVHESLDPDAPDNDARHLELQHAADRAFKTFNRYTQQPTTTAWAEVKSTMDQLGKALSL